MPTPPKPTTGSSKPASPRRRPPTIAEIVAAVGEAVRRVGSISAHAIAKAVSVCEDTARAYLHRPNIQKILDETDPRAAEQLRFWRARALSKIGAKRSSMVPHGDLSIAGLRRAQAAGTPLPEDYNGNAALPAVPTSALPGTDEKIEAMAARYRRREQLFHPNDATPDLVGLPGERNEPAEVAGLRSSE